MAGLVALVTGAARGIGAAVAERLARDGWRVVLLDRDPAGQRTAARLGGRFEPADAGAEADVARAVAELRAREGRLDALVCNAGFGITKRLADLSLAEWNAVLATNLTATFLLARVGDAGTVARRLRARGLRVRDATSFGLPAWIRVGAAPPPWRDELLAALPGALAGAERGR